MFPATLYTEKIFPRKDAKAAKRYRALTAFFDPFPPLRLCATLFQTKRQRLANS